MNIDHNVRLRYFLGFLFIAAILVLAEYLEIYQGMIPCPLCMVQRYFLIALATIFLLGVVFKRGQVFLGLLSLLAASGGILFSARQTCLQYYPKDTLGECGVSFDYMLKTLPFNEVIKEVWQGGMECSEKGWVFLGLSLAEWSLIAFVIFAIFSILQLKSSTN